MQVLLLTEGRDDPRRIEAADRGLAYLAGSTGGEHPPLWHDKDLYAPFAITRAAVIATSYLAARAAVTS
jgi:hypothetical protein